MSKDIIVIVAKMGNCNSQAKEFRYRVNHREMVGKRYQIHEEKANKSGRRMPRLPEARKDVVSCEKVRGFANRK